jgi:hypothetical protein
MNHLCQRMAPATSPPFVRVCLPIPTSEIAILCDSITDLSGPFTTAFRLNHPASHTILCSSAVAPASPMDVTLEERKKSRLLNSTAIDPLPTMTRVLVPALAVDMIVEGGEGGMVGKEDLRCWISLEDVVYWITWRWTARRKKGRSWIHSLGRLFKLASSEFMMDFVGSLAKASTARLIPTAFSPLPVAFRYILEVIPHDSTCLQTGSAEIT